MRLLLLLVVLVGCSPGFGERVDVNVHCGLKNAVVRFDGAEWMFASVDDSNSPPWQWGPNATQVFTVRRSGDDLVAIGPDGWSLYSLIEADGAGSDCL